MHMLDCGQFWKLRKLRVISARCAEGSKRGWQGGKFFESEGLTDTLVLIDPAV